MLGICQLGQRIHWRVGLGRGKGVDTPLRQQYAVLEAGNGYVDWGTLIYPVIGDRPKNYFLKLKLIPWETDLGP